ncbi:MAG: Ion transport 2 domain protein [Myxococcaceae bacterium]|nr:Ion transport 2 domain protein [Myxococcaceae bacterium]
MAERASELLRGAAAAVAPNAGAIERVGDRGRLWDDLYHRLLAAKWRWLLITVFAVYLGMNAVFATLYLLGGDCLENARPGSVTDAFFFSVQTMATIGYGKMVPRTPYANVVVSVEALFGLVSTAMATGLMFAKFARPSARVMFSTKALMVARDGVDSLVFRMANARGNQIVEASLHVTLLRAETTVEGERVRRFHDLALARASNPVFVLSWTAVHPITRASPLHDATPERLIEWDAAVIVSMVGMDETSGQAVHARHSYAAKDIVWGERFVDIIEQMPDGRRRIHFERFNATEPVPGAAQSDGASATASAATEPSSGA